MTLLIYSTKTSGAEERFLRVVELLLPEEKLKFCRSIDDLSNELRQPVFNQRIVILFATSSKELEDFFQIRELLENSKIILILPDTNPATIVKGHVLRPRFLSDYNSDFVDLAAVLSQMIKKLDHH